MDKNLGTQQKFYKLCKLKLSGLYCQHKDSFCQSHMACNTILSTPNIPLYLVMVDPLGFPSVPHKSHTKGISIPSHYTLWYTYCYIGGGRSSIFGGLSVIIVTTLHSVPSRGVCGHAPPRWILSLIGLDLVHSLRF